MHRALTMFNAMPKYQGGILPPGIMSRHWLGLTAGAPCS